MRPQVAGKGNIGQSLAKSKVESEAVDGGEAAEAKNTEWVDEGKEAEETILERQKVYVLDRGFEGWQEVYGKDKRLTENWSEELWGSY